MKWYVIQVVTGKENKILKSMESELKIHNLEKYVEQFIIPKESYYKVLKGKKTRAEKNCYPGYIMIESKMNGELASVIKSIDGVCGFLGGKNPVSLRQKEVNKFLKNVDDLEENELDENYNIDEKVKIINGPFDSFYGDIYSVDSNKKKLTVNVSIFGRINAVEISYDDVERVY